jgi:hypothetical protein
LLDRHICLLPGDAPEAKLREKFSGRFREEKDPLHALLPSLFEEPFDEGSA